MSTLLFDVLEQTSYDFSSPLAVIMYTLALLLFLAGGVAVAFGFGLFTTDLTYGGGGIFVTGIGLVLLSFAAISVTTTLAGALAFGLTGGAVTLLGGILFKRAMKESRRYVKVWTPDSDED